MADSLKRIYDQNVLKDSAKLELLKQLSFNELNDLELSLKYASELIDLSILAEDEKYLFHGYYSSENKYKSAEKLDLALSSFFKSAEVASRIEYTKGEGTAFLAIADVYSVMKISDNSGRYYTKAIEILRKEEEEVNLLAAALLNAGDDSFFAGNYEEALAYFNESLNIFESLDSEIGIAYNLGNIGMVYAEQGQDSLAEMNMIRAISKLEEIKDYYPISVYLTFMSDIYLRKDDYTKALDYAQQSLSLAEKYELKEQIRDANFKLHELKKGGGEFEESLAHFAGLLQRQR